MNLSNATSIISAIFSIVIIDLALSGDNAAVIGLAIRNLPGSQRTMAAILGTGGAIALRILFTILATLLLKIKFLSAVGGIILLFITWKLIRENDSQESSINSTTKFWSAVGTIIVADISMAFDNVMGVAGAAQGNILLIIIGLAVSIPILIIGSSWLAVLMNRYPIVIYIGAGVLAHTALKMIIHDKGLALMNYLGNALTVTIPIIIGILVVLIGFIEIRRERVHYSSRKL